VSTRCKIEVVTPYGSYAIYRHSDGYPEGVISDLWLFSRNYSRSPAEDPEYFLADFMFYCKLSFWLNEVCEDCDLRLWEYGYGVCKPECEHGDLEYIYKIVGNERIEIYECGIRTPDGKPRLIFDGTLDEAYRKYGENGCYREGCHLSKLVFSFPETPRKLLALYIAHLRNLDLIEWHKSYDGEYRLTPQEVLERIEERISEVIG